MPIVDAIAALIIYGLAKKLDVMIGKWVAWITIAWQNASSEAARKAYNEEITTLQEEIIKQHGSWDEWRKKVGTPT